MTTQVVELHPVAEPAVPLEPSGGTRPIRTRIWTIVIFFWKWIVGAVLCLNPIFSVLVVGWTYRLAQRAVLKSWWKRSELRTQGVDLTTFLAGGAWTEGHVHWPNWIVRQNMVANIRDGLANAPGVGAATRCLVRTPLGSLWLNFKIGLQGIFNSWVLTMPACMLWLFAWYDGWNNSFHKGYEQFWVGPLTGWLGVMLFMAAMLYVPMAQVRQAATGNWRSFYQFRLIWSLVRHRWMACLGLAVLYSAVSVPVTILKTMPAFFPQMISDSATWTETQILDFLRQYFFWCCLVVFPVYVLLRLVAARIYASGVLAAIRNESFAACDLAEAERQELIRLDLLASGPRRRRHLLVRAIGWGTSRAARAIGTIAVLLVWFSFVSQIFIAEFFCYHPIVGWLNQPLVQLPWFFFGPTPFAI